MEMGEIVIQNVNQVYHNANQGDFNALSDINLHLCKGESLALLLREKADREKARWQDF